MTKEDALLSYLIADALHNSGKLFPRNEEELEVFLKENPLTEEEKEEVEGIKERLLKRLVKDKRD